MPYGGKIKYMKPKKKKTTKKKGLKSRCKKGGKKY